MTAVEFERVRATYERVRQTQVEYLISLVLRHSVDAHEVARLLSQNAEGFEALRIEHERNPLMTIREVLRMVGFVPDFLGSGGEGSRGYLPTRADTGTGEAEREPGRTFWERLLAGDEG